MKNLDVFIRKYDENFLRLAKIDDNVLNKIKKLHKLILNVKKKGNKIIVAGNGGSAAIASHFSVDMTKNGGVRCINFNESDLLTCFSNDYGYENWVKQAIKFYSDKGDLVILISVSGNSKNLVNGARFSKTNKLKLITFTGFDGQNKLSKLGDVNFKVNSKVYNLVENIHQYWLLSVVDLFMRTK